MIPKAEFFNQIEEYCLDQLNEKEKAEFEKELTVNTVLKDEVQLYRDVRSAIIEKDILTLREQLNQISNSSIPSDTSFELLGDFTNIKEITESLTPEDLISYYDSLPKVHVYHHGLVSGENVHKFYLEQQSTGLNGDEEEIIGDISMEKDLEGWEEAIMEQDIMNLRDTLSYVAKSVQPNCSSEDIDKYINGEMSLSEIEIFEEELARNTQLSGELELHIDVENALKEKDILSLREKLNHIMSTETSGKFSAAQIEDFIDGFLNEDDLSEFLSEINFNADLLSEVNLRRNVNQASGEKDIMELRSRLTNLRGDLNNLEMKTMIPEKIVHVRFRNIWKQSVAVIILLIGITGILNMGMNTSDQMYSHHFNSPEITSFRTVTSSESELFDKANLCYINGEYQQAINLYNQAMAGENEKFVLHFYKAASLQNLNMFQEAIQEYTQVILHGDNLFIEEAEWNRFLCYLKTGTRETARQELLAIVERNGYYKKEAKAILQRWRFSFR